MLRITVWEMIFRTIPEAMVFILAGYVFSNKKVAIWRLLVSSIVMGLSVYLVRMLPIQFGIHTIIALVVYVFLLNVINKINLSKALIISFSCIILLYILEWVNVLFLIKILGQAFYTLRDRPMENILYNYPALALFLLIIIIRYYLFNNSNKKENSNIMEKFL